MPPMKRNAGTDDLHVARTVTANRPAGTERDAVPGLKRDFLVEQILRELGVRVNLNPSGSTAFV